jgi:hypothetical protein
VIGPRPPFVVKSALSKDEMVVVEVKVRRIVKEHFTNLAVKSMPVDIDFEIELLDGFAHVFPELQETTFAREAIRLEQNLVLAVMDHIVGQVLSLGMLAYVLVHSLFSRPREASLKQLLRSGTNYLRRSAIQAGTVLSLVCLGQIHMHLLARTSAEASADDRQIVGFARLGLGRARSRVRRHCLFAARRPR